MNSVQTQYINQVYNGFAEKRKSVGDPVGFSNKEFLSFFDSKISSNEMELSASDLLSKAIWIKPSKRYQFNATTYRARLLKSVFDESYLHCPEKIDALAAKMDPTKKSLYSPLRRVYAIKVPQLVGNTLNNTYLKVVLAICCYVKCFDILVDMYDSTQFFLTAKILPLMINHLPIQAIHSINLTATLTEAVFDLIILIQENIIKILIISYIAKTIIIRLQIPYISEKAQEVSLLSICSIFWIVPQTTATFLGMNALKGAFFIHEQFGNVGQFFLNVAIQNEKERANILHNQAFDAWRTITQQPGVAIA